MAFDAWDDESSEVSAKSQVCEKGQRARPSKCFSAGIRWKLIKFNQIARHNFAVNFYQFKLQTFLSPFRNIKALLRRLLTFSLARYVAFRAAVDEK